MGFLDKFIKNSAKQLISDKLDDITLAVNGNNNTSSTRSMTTAKCDDRDSIHKKLDVIFNEEFSEYEIRKNIDTQMFFAEEGAQNYSYGLFLNGEPKAMIMILDGNNEYRKLSIVKAQKACINQGIPYMNFMSYMSNHYDYVSNRLHQFIR